jgi:hypothetical protein
MNFSKIAWSTESNWSESISSSRHFREMIMYSHFYLRNGRVYVPTMGMMEKGFYRGIEPVAVVSVMNTDALREALAATIARGNPVVAKLRRREWPPPVVLKYAGLKSWSAFERGMMLWSIEEKDSIWKVVGTRKGADGANGGRSGANSFVPAGHFSSRRGQPHDCHIAASCPEMSTFYRGAA